MKTVSMMTATTKASGLYTGKPEETLASMPEHEGVTAFVPSADQVLLACVHLKEAVQIRALSDHGCGVCQDRGGRTRLNEGLGNEQHQVKACRKAPRELMITGEM